MKPDRACVAYCDVFRLPESRAFNKRPEVSRGSKVFRVYIV